MTRRQASEIADPADLLEWLAEERRLVTLGNGKDIQARRAALRAIVREADSFVWRSEESCDGGKTWRLEEEHHMKAKSEPTGTAPAPDPTIHLGGTPFETIPIAHSGIAVPQQQ